VQTRFTNLADPRAVERVLASGRENYGASPARPRCFDPERFSDEGSRGRDPWAYVPFSGGPRVCIGNTFSLVETQVLLAALVQRFDCELLPGQRIVPVAVGTLRPSAPVYVRFSPR
jgi:enediyne biosynthesis protein E7